MGSSFDNILIERASPDELRQAFAKAVKPAGFVPAVEGEHADCAFRFFGAEGDRFWVLVCDSYDEDFLELVKRLARSLKCRAIAARCVDSDALMLSLTKGGAFSTVCVGDPDAYDIEPGPYRAAPWKELVGEERWDAFRAAVEAPYTCAEDALQPLAPLIGFRYPDSVRYFNDPGEPLLECSFRRKVAAPEYLPDDLPPAFLTSGRRLEQGSLMLSFASEGGQGRGVEALVVADGFDADALRLPCVRLARAFYHFRERRDIQAEPRRVRFDDGRIGWVVVFPDAEILPGANPKHPKAHTLEGLERRSHREYFLILPMSSGWSSMRAADGTSSEGVPALDVHLIPMQNRAGGAAIRVALNRPGDGERVPGAPSEG